MGWKLETKEDKYRIFSTITDEFITDWLSRKEILQFLNNKYQQDAKLKLIQEFFKFPSEWSDMENKYKILENDRGYNQWFIEAYQSEDFSQAIENKYQQIIKELYKKEVNKHFY